MKETYGTGKTLESGLTKGILRGWKKNARMMNRVLVIFLVATAGMLLSGCDINNPNDEGGVDPGNDLELVAEGYVAPLGVVTVPGNMDRLFVIDQIGKIWIIDKDANKVETPFLDLSSKLVSITPSYDERGLLGLAFHPDFQSNGKFYVYYQLPPRAGGPTGGGAWDNLSRVSEFKASTANANQADMSSERTVIEWDDPQMNHNGGTIAFGSDGYLYIALGDGGAADDVAPGHVPDWYTANEGGNGQDVEANIFGSILRIDVNSAGEKGYGIPTDNPFVEKVGLDEIYAYGFRNPYRMSFDMGGSNELYVGDAGQSVYEEIDMVRKGGNYGWNVKEGTHCFSTTDNKTTLQTCPSVDVFDNPLIDPIIELNNTANPAGGKAVTIIGGNVYRGAAIPEFRGAYIFGTFTQGMAPDGELFMARPGAKLGSLWDYEEIELVSFTDDLGYYLKGFGQDNNGEIYVTVSTELGPTGTTGKVYKLVKAGKRKK